jgi:hypothetical protein
MLKKGGNVHQITPITADAIRPYIGKPVCAVMHDGTHVYGTIVDCREGHLILSKGVQGPGTVSTSTLRAKKQIRTGLKNKANVSAFTPFFGFGAGAAAFGDIARPNRSTICFPVWIWISVLLLIGRHLCKIAESDTMQAPLISYYE